MFYRQVVGELRKVVWPTRHQLLTYTGVVLVFVLVMMAFIFMLDFAFKSGVLKLFGSP